jgi:predicted nucleotidyltransferase
MMTRTSIIDLLGQNRARLEAVGVRHAALFGSVARNEAGPDSDVDILIEVDKETVRSVFDLARVSLAVSEIVPKAYVTTSDNLKPSLRDHVMRDVVFAF